jgi:hypothetical protein
LRFSDPSRKIDASCGRLVYGSADIRANIRSSNELAERSAMSLALKLDRARQNLEYWQKMAEDPKLSRAEAQIARDLVRSYQAAVAYYMRRRSPIRSGTARSTLDERSVNSHLPTRR